MVDGGSDAKPDSQSSQSAAKAAGAPTDALLAFVDAAATQAKQRELGQPDPGVSVSFALGWQLAELYRPDRRGGGAPAAADDLPGISRLDSVELQQMSLDQLQAGITKLQASITGAGLGCPNVADFAAGLRGMSDGAARAESIRDFHVRLLATLTAADFRLGKAYGLGRALADTTRDAANYATELGWYRVATLTAWIRELASALPPHAAHPVADSLESWSRWASSAGAADQDTRRKLRAQGRVWRSLLSGEKQATDMLETSDYLRAGEGMLQRTGALAVGFLARYWWLALLIVVLFGVGVGLIATSDSGAGIGAGAAGVLASLGLSWKGIGTSLGTVASRLEQPLWKAELDTVIYERITPQTIVDTQRSVDRGPDEPSLVAGI